MKLYDKSNDLLSEREQTVVVTSVTLHIFDYTGLAIQDRHTQANRLSDSGVNVVIGHAQRHTAQVPIHKLIGALELSVLEHTKKFKIYINTKCFVWEFLSVIC